MITMTETKPHEGQIVSEATLQFRDIIPNMLRALPEARQANVLETLKLAGSDIQDHLDSDFNWKPTMEAYLESDGVFDDTLTIEQELQMYAGDYDLWFGSLPGDGACFGFWANDLAEHWSATVSEIDHYWIYDGDKDLI